MKQIRKPMEAYNFQETLEWEEDSMKCKQKQEEKLVKFLNTQAQLI